MYVVSDKPKAEMGSSELKQHELDEFMRGPFALLSQALKHKLPVLVSLRNGHKLLGILQAFDRHSNLVMTNVTEVWTRRGRTGRGTKKARAANRERFISKLFVRGDSVILLVAAKKSSMESGANSKDI
jgi:small nuclear ribonucleoprotein D2